MKASADEKINATQNVKFVKERIEINVEKGVNAGYQNFLPFPQCFQKDCFAGLLKVGIVW